MWLHSLKVAQLLRSAACLHTNQSRSYLNHLVHENNNTVYIHVMLAYQQQKSQNLSSLQSSCKQKMLHDSTTVNPPTCSKQQHNQIPIPKQKTFFLNICFAILNTPLALMFMSCRYKETLDQRLALPKGPKRNGC